MSGTEIKIGVVVDDGGSTKKVTKGADLLVKGLDNVTSAATRAGKAVKASMAPSGGSKTKAALQGATMSPQEGIEYGQARAAVGTGAASRDFAKQAQGLGGLVHVYATFAANLFAVSAAFTALKNAADTTNMIKGLDQLGAQGGRNLGALSKRVAELSDGAVSLREAMTATAQATAAGMSSKNLERLTIVAKNASQALGLAMPDALSRLSRGVTKLEPELLDELGIFVKVEDAVTNYARSVGKSASGLTDFERRHAFALSAIEQGEKKFGSIQLDANPYSKLLASISNLGQKTLELVNTGLSPLVTFLSQSPTALGTALAGVAAILLKQAIPALGMYRENAKKMADEAHKRVIASVEDQKAAASELDSVAAIRAEKAFQTEKSTQDRIAKLQKGRFSQEILGKDLRTSLKKSPFEISSEEISALKSRSEALLASDDDTYKKQGAKLAAHLAKMDALKAESTAKGDAAAAANEARDAKWYSHQEQMQRNLERLNRSAAKRQVLAGVADTAAVLGPVEAFKQLKKETSSLDATKAAKSFTMLQGSLSIASSAAITALNAFGPWIAIFGLISAAVSGLVGYLSKTAKESAATAEAFDGVSSSIDNVTRTMEAMEKRSPLEKISVEAIQARATAFGELSNSIALANQRAFAEIDKMGTSDKFVDWVKKLWGGDVQSKLNETVAQGIEKSFVTMERGPTADKVRKTIKDTLKIDTVDAKSIEKALDGLPEVVRKVKLDTITKDLKDAGIAAQVTAAKGTELKESYAQATKQLQDLRNSFIPSDTVSKLGSTIIESANKLNLALQDPVQTLNAMNAAVKDSNSLSLFPPETAQALIGLKSKVDGLNTSYGDTGKAIEDIDSKISKLDTEKLSLSTSAKDNLVDANRLRLVNQELDKLRDQKEVKTKLLFELDAETKKLGDQFKDAVGKQFEYGAKLIANKLSVEWSKAGSIIGNTIAGLLGDTEAGIKMRAKYESESLSVQKQQILTQISLIKSNEALAISLEQASIDAIVNNPNADVNDRRAVAPRQAALDKRKSMLEGRVTQGSTAALAKEIEKGTLGAKESLNYVMAAEGAYASMAAISAQMGAVAIKQAAELIAKRKKDEQDQLTRDSDSLKAKQDAYAVVESIVGSDSQLLIQQKQQLAIEQLDLDNKKKLLEITKQIEVFEELKSKAPQEGKQSIQNEIDKLDAIKKQSVTLGSQARINLLNKNSVESIKNQYSLQAKETEKNFVKLQESQTLASENLSLEESLLESAKARGGVLEQEYLDAKLLLENKKALLDTQGKIDAIRNTSNAKVAEAESTIDLAKSKLPGATPEAAAALNAEISRQRTLIDEATSSADKQVASLINQLGVRTQINDATAKQAALMSQVASITESLTAVFGDLGTAIGGTVSALMQYGAGSDAMSERHKNTLKGLEKGSDAYTEQEEKNTKERTLFEVDSAAKVAGSAKKMFKEKTGAYKAFAAVEKTLHVISMAMKVKEMIQDGVGLATKIAKNGAGMASDAIAAGVSGVKAVVNAIASMPFPLNIAAGAATAAVVAGLLKSIGGSGPSVSQASFAPNSEQIQETQGTGQTWNSAGQKVSDIGGILGDDEAKANSVVNSLEILKNNSFESLDYDNKLLRSFQNIADAIGKATNTVLTSGLRTTPVSILEMLVGKKEGGFGSSIPIVGKLLGSIFGGGYSESSSITSQRLELKGTFDNVSKDISSGLRQVTDVLVTWQEDGGWFGSDSSGSYIRQIVGTVPEDIKAAFSDIFANFKQGYAEIAKMMGKDNALTFVADKLKTVELKDSQGNPLKFDYTGLKGDEIKTELEAYFSKINNIALNSLFPEFKEFETAGEDYGTTVIRVIQNTKQVQLALTALGSASATAMQGLQGYRFADKLIELAGGLENFIDQSKNFSDNFLTETERLVPVQKAVIKEMARLGFASVDTRAEFKALVQGLDLTTVSGRENYQALMDVAEGFDTVLDYTEAQADALRQSAQGFRDFIVQIKEFKNSLLLGASSTLTPGEKYAEARAQFDAIYAQALAGDKIALSKVTNSAQTFLDASKTYLASSDAYTSDFNFILSKLDNAVISAGASASVAELQLNALSIHTDLLSSINTNIALIAGVPAAAGGGRVSGLTLVGEMGPELVDFTTPGRVYTADQTAGMFAPGRGNQAMAAVVVELQQLRQEVTQLRKDQQKQTGDLIISNYDAHQKSSEEIATAVVESSQDVAWTDRSKSEIK